MANKTEKKSQNGLGRRWLQPSAVRLTRVHFLYILAYLLVTIVFDSWNLYTHEAVTELWTAAGVLLAINVILWYIARQSFNNGAVYRGVVSALVLADIGFAAYNVYWQQGLASKSVALFAIPIVTAAALKSRSALLTTATLSAATYAVVAVRYFYQNYGEGYRVELYGTVGFYCAIFFVLALLLLVIISDSKEKF